MPSCVFARAHVFQPRDSGEEAVRPDIPASPTRSIDPSDLSSDLDSLRIEARRMSEDHAKKHGANCGGLPFPRHIRVITATPIALLTFDFLQPEPDWHWSPEKEKAFRERMARMDSEQEAREEEWRKRKTSLLPDDGGALARAWAKARSGSSSPGTGSN